MFILSSEQMRRVDAETIETVCPGLELMERAGRGCASLILDHYGEDGPARAAIFVGPGNNGGDGLVIARLLAQAGWKCSVHLLSPVKKFSVDAAKNYQRLRELMAEMENIVEFDATRPDWTALADEDLAGVDVVVDAILGTGSSGAPRGVAAKAIARINACDAPVVSIDIPSGVDGSTGDVPGEAVVAHETMTLGAPKMGLLFQPGRHFAAAVSVIDIGFPDEIIEKHADPVYLLDRGEAVRRLPYRTPDVHKFSAGAVLVVAGSVQYRGAALLSAEAALRGGCGMVYLGVPASIRGDIDVALREAITVALPETADGTVSPAAVRVLAPYLERVQALAVGPGLGRNDATAEFVETLLGASLVPTVVDADAITAFAGRADAFAEFDTPVVLTPHSGELARLLGEKVPERAPERIEWTAEAARRLRVTLLHKGATTLIAEPLAGVYVNTSGNSALATAGSGDVLTGLVGSFLAQGASTLDAACLAAYLHGRAGENMARERGRRGVIASDLFDGMGTEMVILETLAGE